MMKQDLERKAKLLFYTVGVFLLGTFASGKDADSTSAKGIKYNSNKEYSYNIGRMPSQIDINEAIKTTGPPPLPSEYYGQIYLNGELVGENVSVYAWLDVNGNKVLDTTGVSTPDSTEVFHYTTTYPGGWYDIISPGDCKNDTTGQWDDKYEGGTDDQSHPNYQNLNNMLVKIISHEMPDATPILEWRSGSNDMVDLYVEFYPDSLPEITLLTPPDDGVTADSLYELIVKATDPDNNGQYSLFTDDNNEGFDGQPLPNLEDIAEEDMTKTHIIDLRDYRTGRELYFYAILQSGGKADSSYAPGSLIIERIVGIDDNNENNNPNQLKLFPNYPNPFNDQTKVKYILPESGEAIIRIYNLKGEGVYSSSPGVQGPGTFEFIWSGQDMPSGIYPLTLQQKDNLEIKRIKMMLVK